MSKKRETKVASDGGPEEDVRRVDEPLTIEDREQLERFRSHQERFKERRGRVEFGRWKASMHLTKEEQRARLNKPLPPLVSLPKRS
jgi:hypothetical protein